MKLADLASTHQQRLAQIGPGYWAQLHAWADRFKAEVGNGCGCGDLAVTATHALHDAVNVSLKKPVKYPVELRQVAVCFQEAVGHSAGCPTTLKFTVKDKEALDHLFEAERHLNQAGISFDTGSSGSDRDWELDWSLKGAKLRQRARNGVKEQKVVTQVRQQPQAVQTSAFLARFPNCTPAQAARLERCIREVKAKGTARNPWAVCTASIGCRFPASKRGLPSINQQAPCQTPGLSGTAAALLGCRRGTRMSASLLEFLLNGAAQAAGATAAATLVSRVMGGTLAVTSPEAMIRVVDDREERRKREEARKGSSPSVHNPKTVEGDQATVDLGTLLAEIDLILKNPSKMGEVNPQTLQVVREGS